MKTDLFQSCGQCWVFQICWHIEYSITKYNWVNWKEEQWENACRRGLYFVSQSRSVVSNSLGPHGIYSPWNSPGQATGVGSLSLLQKIFPTQGLNPGLPHCRWILYQLSHKGSPYYVSRSLNICLQMPFLNTISGHMRRELDWENSQGKIYWTKDRIWLGHEQALLPQLYLFSLFQTWVSLWAPL